MRPRKLVRVAALALLLHAAAAFAQDFERIAPKPVPPPGQTNRDGPQVAPRDTAIQLNALKGLVFLTDPKSVNVRGVSDVSGVDVSRVPELQTDAFRARVASYIGRPVSARSVDALVNDVVAYFTELDRPFVIVTSPEQDITGGVIQLLVIEGRVGKIDVAGARVFDERIYRNALGLKPGDSIRKRRLDADVDFLNLNPFRTVTVDLAPGETVGTTDITLRAQERPPLRVYGGYDDSGTDVTANMRVFAGANWGNVFGLDHQINYQFTTSDDFNVFRAHSLTYVAPLPWKHLLSVTGGHADIRGRVPASFALDGRSQSLGLGYEIPLLPLAGYRHAVIVGLDFKRSNNNLAFGGATVSATSADIFQGLLTYQGRALDAYGGTSFKATLFYSPGNITSRNDDVSFQRLRAFSKAEYTYTNLQLQRVTRLPAEFSWQLSAEVQFADGNLLGSEQIGAGGYSTVRGYDEREANGDGGFLIRNELRTPSFNLGAPVAGKEAQIQFLTFLDYGSVRIKHLLPGERRHIELASAGLGTRFSVDQNVTVRFDYGWQLKDSGFIGSPRSGRAHFSLLVSY